MRILPLLSLALLCGTAQAQTTFFVDVQSGNDANTGLTPATAFQTIPQALSVASTNPAVVDTINVAPGFYPGGIFVNFNVKLEGRPEATINGTTAGFGIFVDSQTAEISAETQVKNFTFLGDPGSDQEVIGVLLSGPRAMSPRVENNRFQDCYYGIVLAQGLFPGALAEGVSRPLLRYNEMVGPEILGKNPESTGIFLSSDREAEPELIANRISSYTFGVDQIGMLVEGTPSLRPRLRSEFIWRCATGVRARTGTATRVTNESIALDDAPFDVPSGTAIGVESTSETALLLTNSIVWTMDDPGGFYLGDDVVGAVTVASSILFDGGVGSIPGIASPGFVDLSSGDLELTSTSPALDIGNSGLVLPGGADVIRHDVRGNPRVLDGQLAGAPIVDIGAHEFNTAVLDISAPGLLPGYVASGRPMVDVPAGVALLITMTCPAGLAPVFWFGPASAAVNLVSVPFFGNLLILPTSTLLPFVGPAAVPFPPGTNELEIHFQGVCGNLAGIGSMTRVIEVEGNLP
ncbi:MAG: hypothetical protein AAF682_08435 [Planctomycetota bacterium]